MNHSKLLRRNLSKPINDRLSHNQISDKTKYFAKLGLLAAIHSQIAPELKKLWDTEDIFLKIGSLGMGAYEFGDGGERESGKRFGSSHNFETEGYKSGHLEPELGPLNSPILAAALARGFSEADSRTSIESNSEFQKRNDFGIA